MVTARRRSRASRPSPRATTCAPRCGQPPLLQRESVQLWSRPRQHLSPFRRFELRGTTRAVAVRAVAARPQLARTNVASPPIAADAAEQLAS
jgi:hypothetical protein